jgi:N-acetylmuramoyl-L-alanine amidase
MKIGSEGDAVHALQQSLARYGYGIKASGTFDNTTAEVVTAFQRHFRPERVDGVADPSTLTTLQALLESLPAPANAESDKSS